jgi:hypothetical protein
MDYVKHFDILGVDTAQIPCIELQGVPNAATVGAVGLLGMDMTSDGHELYVCTAVNGSVYTWQSLKDGKDGVSVIGTHINLNGELIITLSNGTEINAGVVRGEKGEPGKDAVDGVNGRDGRDGVDGKDGLGVVSATFNGNKELVFTMTDGTTIVAGKVIPSLKDLVGSVPIGDKFHCVYYDGEKFVSSSVAPREITLASATWEEINRIAQEGEASRYFYIGEEKKITLSTGEEVSMVILGFDHDDLADGTGKAKITFGMKHLLSTAVYLGTNQHDVWASSRLYQHVLGVYSMFPSDVQAVVKKVTKKSLYDISTTTSQGKVATSTDTIFLFSLNEVGILSYTPSTSEVYEYYYTVGSRVKRLGNGVTDVCPWWLRDKGKYVTGTGEASYGDTVSNTFGICVGFCI